MKTIIKICTVFATLSTLVLGGCAARPPTQNEGIDWKKVSNGVQAGRCNNSGYCITYFPRGGYYQEGDMRCRPFVQIETFRSGNHREEYRYSICEKNGLLSKRYNYHYHNRHYNFNFFYNHHQNFVHQYRIHW